MNKVKTSDALDYALMVMPICVKRQNSRAN